VLQTIDKCLVKTKSRNALAAATSAGVIDWRGCNATAVQAETDTSAQVE
jgi:hypothetical protein